MRQLKVWICLLALTLALPAPNVFAAPSRAKLYAMIQDLQATVATLQTQLASVQANPAVEMGDLGYVKINAGEMNGVAGPNIVFEGVNIHLQDGVGSTVGTSNGLGNLIIGYDEVPDVLLPGDRGGSHNFIMGREHKFLSNDSILHGWGGVAKQHAVAILAGDGTVVNSSYSVGIAGLDNVINGGGSAAIGGWQNVVSGYRAASVGGRANVISGESATVTGGTDNNASGLASSISGGTGVPAVNENSWAAGTLSE